MNAAASEVPEAEDLPTKQRILLTAERMFAEEGYKSVSLRSITRACGVNLAALHYHFGSKDRLLQDIFDLRCGPMNEERLRLLANCRDAPDRPPMVEQIIKAYLMPTLVWPQEDLYARRFMRLRAVVGYEQEDLARNLISSHFDKVSRNFIKRLRAHLPHLGSREFYWRFHALLGAHYYTMANPGRIQHLSGGLCDPSDGAAALRYLVPQLAAGFMAPAVDPLPANS